MQPHSAGESNSSTGDGLYGALRGFYYGSSLIDRQARTKCRTSIALAQQPCSGLARILAAPRPSTRWGSRLCDRRLRPENLHQGLVGALLVGVSTADANRPDQLIIHDDG